MLIRVTFIKGKEGLGMEYCISESSNPFYSSAIKTLCGNKVAAINCSCLSHREILAEYPRYGYCTECLMVLENKFICVVCGSTDRKIILDCITGSNWVLGYPCTLEEV